MSVTEKWREDYSVSILWEIGSKGQGRDDGYFCKANWQLLGDVVQLNLPIARDEVLMNKLKLEGEAGSLDVL
jgi:hypothetical protein